MAGKLGSLLIDLQLNTATLNKQVGDVNKKLSGMSSTIKKVGVALAGAFAVRGFTNMIDSTLKMNDALGKTADRLGLTAQELQQLHFTAEQSGISTATLEMALQRMTRRVSEAGKGTGEAVKALKEMGISADQLAKMSVNDQLKVLADKLSGVTSEADQVRLAMKLFDSEGVKLLTMLKNGSGGLEDMANEANSLGFVLDRQMIAKMEQANDSMNRVSKISQGFKNVLTTALAPAITAITDNFVEWVTEGDGANGMLSNLHSGIRSVLKAFDVLNASVSLSISGWQLIGSSIDLVAETFFGTAEGVKRAEGNIRKFSEIANTKFADAVEAFDNGGALAKDFDINLGSIAVTATKTGDSLTNLADVTTKTTEKLTEDQKSIQHVFTNAFSNMENSMVEFAKSGKLAFKDFAESILEDLLRMIIQLQITIPLMNSLKASMGAGGGLAGGLLSMFGFAKGGVFSGGDVQPFAKGGVVSSPTLFPMASGMGLMGEAGSEAIMPLTRTAGGDLGVKAVGGGGGTQINIYNQSGSQADVKESTDSNGQKTIDIMIKASVERSVGNGSLDGVFSKNYGISRKGY